MYPFALKKVPTKPINTGFVGIYLFIQTQSFPVVYSSDHRILYSLL